MNHKVPNLITYPKLIGTHLMLPQLIKHSLEIIEKDRVRHALEDESKLPEGIDAADIQNRGHGQNVDDNECYAQTHTQQQNAKARRGDDELGECEAVVAFDVPQEVDGCEEPPWIAEGRNISITRVSPKSSVKITYRHSASYGLVLKNNVVLKPLKYAKFA